MKVNFEQAKPFVKWAGGKTQILPEIRKQYPFEFGNKITKYAEPFVGGGAVLFDVLNRYSLDSVYISDINRELILTYISIRDNCERLVKFLRKLENEYLGANIETRKEIFYSKRVRFNELKIKHSKSIEIAALFIFLNHTCFNGLYRVNSKGLFNVPQGNYKNPLICDEENLRNVSRKLKNVEIVCGSYRLSSKFIDKKTLVYFDPPYRPLSATSSFVSYTEENFDDNAQIELAKYIEEVSRKGALIIASNSDPKNTNRDDNFFDCIYSKLKINRIFASRAINSLGENRGKISELLISNY